MKIVATAHIKKDRTEIRIEVWDADNWSKGAGLPIDLRIELKNRGYIDTGSNITGLRLTIPAAQGKAEMEWLKTKNIPLTTGNYYE